MCQTGIPPENFNISFIVLPPKGEKPADKHKVTRAAEDTRPLSLKHTDNKICAATMNNKVAAPLTGWANKSQRGFVKERQGF